MTTTQLKPTEDTLLKFDQDTIGRVVGIDEEREGLRVFRNGDQVKICFVVSGSLTAFLVETMAFSEFLALAN